MLADSSERGMKTGENTLNLKKIKHLEKWREWENQCEKEARKKWKTDTLEVMTKVKSYREKKRQKKKQCGAMSENERLTYERKKNYVNEKMKTEYL